MWVTHPYYIQFFERLTQIRRRISYRKKIMRGVIKRTETVQLEWMQIGSKISASQAALAATAMTYSDLPSTAFKLSPGMNGIEMRFLCDTDDQGGTARVYACRENGDIVQIASLAVTTGGQTTTRDGSTMYYIDTINVTDTWFKVPNGDGRVLVADGGGGNRMARVSFDVLGYRWVFVRIEYSGSHDWYVDVSGF